MGLEKFMYFLAVAIACAIVPVQQNSRLLVGLNRNSQNFLNVQSIIIQVMLS